MHGGPGGLEELFSVGDTLGYSAQQLGILRAEIGIMFTIKSLNHKWGSVREQLSRCGHRVFSCGLEHKF